MRRRAVGLFFICAAAVPLAIVSTAWACGVLASLTVTPNTVSRGQTVQATGVNYARNTCANEPPTCDPATSASAVTLRWNSRTGPIIGTDTTVQSDGKLNTSITIPSAAKLGSNIVLALQNRSDGAPKSGTPGRTTVQVASASRTRGDSVPGGAWGAPAKPGGPAAGDVVTIDGAGSASPALLPTLLGGLLTVGLFGTGLTLIRRSRTGLGA